MGSTEHEKVSLAHDQFHIISREVQTNGFYIGFVERH